MSSADSKSKNPDNSGIKRRDWLKGISTLPVFGGLALSTLGKWNHDQDKKSRILKELGVDDIRTEEKDQI